MKRLFAKGSVLIAGLPAAAVQAQVQAATGRALPDTGSMLLQTFFGLVVVVLMILGLAWLARRANLTGLSRNNPCKVLATLPLSTREKAVLVDIAGQQFLLGVAPGSVTTLHVFEQPVVVAPPEQSGHRTVKSYSRLAASSQAEFSRKLSEFLGPGNRQG